jgi:hypothetical protein
MALGTSRSHNTDSLLPVRALDKQRGARLPGLDGPALYDWMAEYRPYLCARTAFITADMLSVSSHRFLARTGRPVLEKPFVPAELRQSACAASALARKTEPNLIAVDVASALEQQFGISSGA